MNLSFNFTDFLIVLVILVSAGYACWRGFPVGCIHRMLRNERYSSWMV